MRAAVIALPIFLAGAVAMSAALVASPGRAEEPVPEEAPVSEPAAPTIYKWIDEHGIAHYTTDRKRIPDRLRDKIGRPAPPREEVARPLVEDVAVQEAIDGPLVEEAPVEEAVAPPEAPPRAPAPDPGEQWAVRDRSYERPGDAWDAADDYGDAPTLKPTTEEDVESAAEAPDTQVVDRRQQLAELDERIALLETDIAANEEALKALITLSVPEGGGAIAMADDAQFREIAGRLPGLLADLRALQDEREQLEAP